jgi:hypothetical protein
MPRPRRHIMPWPIETYSSRSRMVLLAMASALQEMAIINHLACAQTAKAEYQQGMRATLPRLCRLRLPQLAVPAVYIQGRAVIALIGYCFACSHPKPARSHTLR